MSRPAPESSWIVGKHALLSLRASRGENRTEVAPLARRIPYQWQGVHFQDHDDQAFVLLHSSAGGLVEGDVAEFHLDAEPQARVLLTTTSATRFYKCVDGGQSVDLVSVTAREGALVEYLPDETIPFARSRVVRRLAFEIDETSRLFASDLLAAGRVNSGQGEAFAFSGLRSELEVRIAGRNVLLDRLVASRESDVAALESLWGGHRYLATIAAYAPDLPARLEEEVRAAVATSVGVELGVTRRDRLVLARLLADECWQAHETIHDIWSVLRPFLAGKPARRIRKP